jgi:hypothetical protein
MSPTKRIAFVTGGMGGLGEAICIKLAALDIPSSQPTPRAVLGFGPGSRQ